jgi:hypothetical protein
MLCRQCGTEIADKAIVCYRCGAATTDPVRQPARIQGRRNPLLGLVVIALLVLLALFLGQASRTAAEPNVYRTIAGVLLGAAVILLIVRIARRR